MPSAGSLPVEEGPWFEDFQVGDVFEHAPAVTLTPGLAAVHQSIVGNRLRLCLDRELCRRVTGAPGLAYPALAWDVAIGQSTVVTHHVVANLFYRGLAFRRLPALGDTLATRTEVVALKENSRRPGRRPTGLAALRITTVDQATRPVLDFWRCAMLPLRDPSVRTGHGDDMKSVGRPPDTSALRGELGNWDLTLLQASMAHARGRPVRSGDVFQVGGGDVVSGGAELARLTTNVASVHHDTAAAGGQRLVYGGHSIALALAQLSRALPQVVTVLAWDSCDHLGPVHEGDTLHSTVFVGESYSILPGLTGTRLRLEVESRPVAGGESRPVLDWHPLVLLT